MAKNGFSMSNRVAVEQITADRTLTKGDCGKVLVVDSRGAGALTITLPDGAAAEDGWNCTVLFESSSKGGVGLVQNVVLTSSQDDSSDGNLFFRALNAIADAGAAGQAKSVTAAYDNFLQAANEYGSGRMWEHNLTGVPLAINELYELKRKLYRAVANVYILEGVRFYVSFACSFAFGELKLLEGSAKIIGLIARDESQHMTVTQNIIKNWQKGDDPDMKEIVAEEEENVYNMFRECVEEEKSWANYLFKDGSIIGLNDKLLSKYVEWTANRRLKSIGLNPIFDAPIANNPLPWTAHWLSSKGMQVAPQETEVESYLIGSIKQDVKKDTFSNFKL